MGVVAASVLYFALAFNGGATGKYLFPAFPSMALVLAGGALAWCERSVLARWRGWLAVGLLTLSAAATVYALVGLLLPAYGPPHASRGRASGQRHAAGADLGGTAPTRLPAERRRAPRRRAVSPSTGSRWTSPRPVHRVRYLRARPTGVIANRTLPRRRTTLTDAWVVGRPFVDTYYYVPPDAPAAAAELRLGLYAATGRPSPGPTPCPTRLGIVRQVTVTP
jgi:hypothetical protein